jgi:hypothetical protein
MSVIRIISPSNVFWVHKNESLINKKKLFNSKIFISIDIGIIPSL